eukprot:scaffold744_cov370-Prasinococcus_capsulatus_cf.AAC.14
MSCLSGGDSDLRLGLLAAEGRAGDEPGSDEEAGPQRGERRACTLPRAPVAGGAWHECLPSPPTRIG